MNKEKENLCSSCEHEKMCKFKQDFITAEKEFYKKETEVSKLFEEDNLVEVKINCKFYSAFKNIFNKKSIDITPSPSTLPYTIYTTTGNDPCESCEWHKSWLTKLSTGEIPSVGDSPCEWCMYSKVRVTCNSNNISNE